MYLNSFLHIMGYSWGYQILVVDMEGETWRKIPCLCHSEGSIHQAQGHLCVCTVCGRDMPKLYIWILEDYGTNKWTLKHTVSTLDVFAETNIEFGYLDVDQYYSTVHPKWNLLLFFGVAEENDIVAYNMHSRKVHVIPTHYSAFLKVASYHKSTTNLTIFPMFPCSRSWSHQQRSN